MRGFLAFVAVVVVIAYVWGRLDDEPASKAVIVAADPPTTTVVAASTTTTTPEQAQEAICELTDSFAADVRALGADPEDGPVARLATDFWAAVLPDLPTEIRTEAVAVVEYYQSYMEVSEPFDHDPVRIIVEGDKERYEQLLTRPAPGLESSRAFLLFTCGVEVPDQPSMSEGAFASLEERLLDPDPLQR
jgi:hypothetical protein